jgi:Ca2+-binding EF-hand superfamily protein
MNMTWKTSAAMACLLCCIAIAQAQTPPATPTQTPAPTSPQAQQAEAQEALFASWDSNHDKSISRDEFKAGWQQLQTTMALRQLHDQFVVMDTSKNDCIDASEYAQLELVKKAGTSAPPLATFDADKTQCLNFKEYVGLVQNLAQRKQK